MAGHCGHRPTVKFRGQGCSNLSKTWAAFEASYPEQSGLRAVGLDHRAWGIKEAAALVTRGGFPGFELSYLKTNETKLILPSSQQTTCCDQAAETVI